MNYINISKKFLEMEIKHNLFHGKIYKFEIWGAFRHYCFTNILENSKKYGKVYQPIKIKYNTCFNFINLLRKSNFKLLFFKKYNYVILEHHRDNLTYDPITKDIENELKAESYIRMTYSEKFQPPKRRNSVYLDGFKVFSKLISWPFFFLIPEKLILGFKDFSDEFNMPDQSKLYKRYILEYVILFKIYSYLFKKWNTKALFVVVSYTNFPLICAAKHNNVTVFELQHGFISTASPAYNYHINNEINYLPNYFLSFSNYWNKYVNFGTTTCTAIGNSEFVVKTKPNKKKQKTLLIISQPTIAKQLNLYIKKNIKTLNSYQIFYKLHPADYNTWTRTYPIIKTLNENFSNFHIITKTPLLGELFDKSIFVLGVYSTALFEGIEHNCITLILNIDGSEMLSNLIETKQAVLVDKNKNLIDTLTNVTHPPVKKTVFFEKFDKSVFNRLVQYINQ
jgi:hypothetical protein